MNEDAKTWMVQLTTITLCFVAVIASLVFVFERSELTIDRKINNMTPPITVSAILTDGTVILTDDIGEVVVVENDYYLSQVLRSAFKPGHVLLKD